LSKLGFHVGTEYQSLIALSKPLAARRLQTALQRAERNAMSSEVDLTALTVDELRALVHELRRQLADRDEEIARLRQAPPSAVDTSATEDSQMEASAAPEPGSQEDLLAQLEQLYPDGKGG
jgi:hypothetical protein